MDFPIEETLNIVRSFADPVQAWDDIVDQCRTTAPNAPWETLPTLNVERDVTAAMKWVSEELASTVPDANGLYLGLDTLNMRDGRGSNIEIGGSAECDPLSDDIEWVFARNLDHGNKHLIRGLLELQTAYSSDDWKSVFSLCDYIFFLGYSGIILVQTFKLLPTSRTLLPVWGFHDGDLFALGRKRDGEFARICR